MARTFRQPGNTVTLIAPAKTASGDIVAIGAIVGVAQFDAESGAEVEVSLTGIHELPKASGEVNAGDVLYFDTPGKALTKTVATNTFAGVAVSHAGTNDATVFVRLCSEAGALASRIATLESA
jgi:predicted RecA/RadA family phage recombinase